MTCIWLKELAMNVSRLMIVMAEKPWTLAALHLACAMARRGEANVTLVKMVPVRHPLLLGTEAGLLNFSSAEATALRDMSATAEDYGVSLDIRLFQYANYWPGVVDAAAQLAVTAVLAHIPHSPIPYWQKVHRGWLRRRLGHQQQLLFVLDDLQPSLVWTPSVALQNNIAHSLAQRQS